eukprot:2239609-Prymnesium_polylepis.1
MSLRCAARGRFDPLPFSQFFSYGRLAPQQIALALLQQRAQAQGRQGRYTCRVSYGRCCAGAAWDLRGGSAASCVAQPAGADRLPRARELGFWWSVVSARTRRAAEQRGTARANVHLFAGGGTCHPDTRSVVHLALVSACRSGTPSW